MADEPNASFVIRPKIPVGDYFVRNVRILDDGGFQAANLFLVPLKDGMPTNSKPIEVRVHDGRPFRGGYLDLAWLNVRYKRIQVGVTKTNIAYIVQIATVDIRLDDLMKPEFLG
jgi:hypothetical protein